MASDSVVNSTADTGQVIMLSYVFIKGSPVFTVNNTKTDRHIYFAKVTFAHGNSHCTKLLLFKDFSDIRSKDENKKKILTSRIRPV